MIDYSTLPEHMQEGMQLYIEKGVQPGSFLTAVLENNFILAFANADHINIQRMKDYAVFLFREAPRGCYGSQKIVERWIKRKKEEANDLCQMP